MDRLLEVRLGGGRLRSGMLPVRAFGMLQDLLASIADEGGDPGIWRETNPHVEIVGSGSSLASVHTEFASQLRPHVLTFARRAEALELGAKGLDFVARNITMQTPWSYVELIPLDDAKKTQPVRFDMPYRERIQERQATLLKGLDEVYAYVQRAGGEPPGGPTVQLQFPGGGSKTYRVADKDLSQRLGRHLYETVKLAIEAEWDPVSLSLNDLRVVDLDEEWRDVHLHDVLSQHNGRLPVELTTDSVEDLLASRARERDED